jgi:hypothetical protein
VPVIVPPLSANLESDEPEGTSGNRVTSTPSGISGRHQSPTPALSEMGKAIPPGSSAKNIFVGGGYGPVENKSGGGYS